MRLEYIESWARDYPGYASKNLPPDYEDQIAAFGVKGDIESAVKLYSSQSGYSLPRTMMYYARGRRNCGKGKS